LRSHATETDSQAPGSGHARHPMLPLSTERTHCIRSEWKSTEEGHDLGIVARSVTFVWKSALWNMQYIRVVDLKEAYRRQQLGYAAAEADRVARLRGRTDDQWLKELKLVWGVREPDPYFFETALRLQKALLQEGISFCFIGGLAVQRWGEVRRTVDIDLTALCDLGKEVEVLEKLQRILTPRSEDVRWLVLNARMYLGVTDDGRNADISLGYTPYEKRVLKRSVDVEFGVSEPLRCCSAEDLVIFKTIAGRDIDRSDLRRIIQVSGRTVDWDLVFGELGPLLDLVEKPERADELRELVEREL